MGGARFSPVVALLASLLIPGGLLAAGRTRLVPLPPPRIVASADAVFLSASNPVENLIDGNVRTEYASAGKGLDTFIEFDFGSPTRLAGFRHQDRKNGTISGSELVFYDASGREIRRIALIHPDRSGAVTFQAIWPAVLAQRVRWQVTKLGVGNAGAVGGAEIGFYGAGSQEPASSGIAIDAVALPIATREGGDLWQPLKVSVDYPYAEPMDATLRLGDGPARPIHLAAGPHTEEFSIPAETKNRLFSITLSDGDGRTLVGRDFHVPDFRRMTIYVLPHSHVDIGYTEIQTAIEEKQLNNLLSGISAARRTADYPEGAKFVWNLEGLWAADLLLQRLDNKHQEDFFAAVKQGQVALNGMYFNTLTGLCRPEELTRLFRFGTKLSALTGVPVDAAMISDVPGYTWGTVTAMAQAGIKYFSAAPNVFDRIGDTYDRWENKPFWWVGPSGEERVLVWVPPGGYNLAARIRRLTPEWVRDFTEELVKDAYPYHIDYIRWSRGDNASPDAAISDQVRDWNETHAWPHFVIGSVSEAFRALEKEDGPRLPEYRGDWTPYWEDGAGSSALETALNRGSSDRLAQAEALWAMQQPSSYPAADFASAMKEVFLYDEHTWGASTSVTAPDGKRALDQWQIKSSHAAAADVRSRDLLMRALSLSASGAVSGSSVDVFNTNSWTRSGLVLVGRDLSTAGDSVSDEEGRPVASQRLASGELAIFVRGIPAFSSRRYLIAAGIPAAPDKPVIVSDTMLENDLLRLSIDPKEGGITELRKIAAGPNLADVSEGGAINDYLYFNGSDPSKARRNGTVKIRIKEKGPLVASLRIESSAPGCHRLVRELTLVAGEDHVELSNLVDKERLEADNYRAPEGKESVNFAFPFNIPNGQVRIEVPFGVVRPDADQIPGACKNWFTMDRWTDVSNAEHGVTLVSLDAPLVQVGGLTANLLNSQTNAAVWKKEIGPTQKLFVWVMNNHWGTNYRAFQEGPVTFRFQLQPHSEFDAARATRLAVEASQPMLAVRAHERRLAGPPLLEIGASDVVVTGLKPSDDGRALIARLWNAGDHAVKNTIEWSGSVPRSVSISGTGEEIGGEIGPSLVIPSHGVLTLRAELQ